MFIADNGSTDDSLARVKSGPRVAIIQHEIDLGFARANIRVICVNRRKIASKGPIL